MKRLTAALLCLTLPLAADEGMWLFNQFPADTVNQKYKFQIPSDFVDNLRLASVRIAGGSGSFVSPTGLLLTNQHLATGCLTKNDRLKDGFYAAAQSAELPCPGLEAAVLTAMEDVTGHVKAATKDNVQQRNAAAAKLEQECAARTGNRCAVVKLFSGNRYDLYQYKTYTDIRLVFAPENDLAFFGRQRDSLTYLRYGLDIAFLRAYENGKPAATPHFLKWSAEPVKEDDLLFTAGNPQPTMRLATAAQLAFYRDTQLPFAAGRLKPLIQKLGAYAGENAENLRAAEPVLTGLLTEYKTAAGMLIGLRDDRMATRKTVFEGKIRRAVQANSKLGMEATKVWDEVAAAYKTWTPYEKPYQLLESGAAPGSELFRTARQFIRQPEAVRPADTLPDSLEILLLTQYLEELKNLGDKEAPLKAILGGKSPAEVAAELVKITRLKSRDSIKPDDPMVRLASTLEEPAKRLRKKREEILGSLETTSAEKIEQYRLQLFKETEYPDATGMPRLQFGTVKPYTDRAGVAMPFASTFGGLYYRQNNEGPYQVPQKWVDLKSKLNLVTQLDFVTTCDIGAGNPGSPVINRAGELAGVTFDGNLESLPGIYLYTDEQARAVHVSVEGIAEALDQIYQARPLLQELNVHRDLHSE